MSNEVAKKTVPQVTPAADILQKDDAYFIILDMPGVDKEDLEISVDNKSLTVEAKTSYPEVKNEKYLEHEFSNVQYTRKFTLSDSVDKNNIEAQLKNGLLRLHLPKVPELKPKKIEIQAG